MKVLGLTGGIGSGKSTIARIFQVLGIPVYNADDRAKWLMSNDFQIKQALRKLFGALSMDALSKPDYKFIGEQAFSDPEKLRQLNQLIHPAVADDFIKWRKSRTEVLLVKEAAILFETGSNQLLDGVIVVCAPEKMRIQRVMQRNGLSEEAVKLRMSKQWPEEKLLALADFQIVNDESMLVIPQVISIVQLFTNQEIA
jgi:dephospho-CoA kinase